jgi:hypothetical protein
MQFRALTDLYMPDGRYIQAGSVFDAPAGWPPPTHAVMPLDPDATQAYWAQGPRFNYVEAWRQTFTNSARWSDVPVPPPTTWWTPVDPKNPSKGYVLSGAGSNYGPRPPMPM